MPKHQYGRLDYTVVGIETILNDLGVEIFDRREGHRGTEFRLACPHKAHDDATPSCDLNSVTGNWFCLSHPNRRPGNGEGSFETFITLWVIKHAPEGTRLKRADIIKDLESRYPALTEYRFVDPALVQEHVNSLPMAPEEMVEALRVRGITMDMLRESQIGFNTRSERFTIPVFDEHAHCVNIRQYKPGAATKKMTNLDGFASRDDLYRVTDCKYDTIWLCGGELKAIVGGWYLNQRKVGAVSPCSGEGQWSNEWVKHFKGKVVYVCMDVDAAGRFASEKYARQLHPFAKEVHVVSLPLDVSIFRKGDLNDWIFHARSTGKNVLQAFDELIADNSTRWMPPAESQTVVEPIYIEEPLTNFASKPPVKNQRVACDVRFVTGIVTDTFLLPAKLKFTCPRAIEENGADCQNCVVWRREEHTRATTNPSYVPNINEPVEVSVNLEDADILEFIKRRKNDDISRKLAFKLAGVYPSCKHVTRYELLGTMPARQVEAVDASGDAQLTRRHAVVLNPPQALDPAIAYRIDARLELDPRDHRAVVLIDRMRPADDTIDTFEPLREDEISFQAFMPDEPTVEGIEAKLYDIADWLSANVTFIYGRRDLHLVADLTYHSVLELPVIFGKQVETGWINSLILGDTGEGKSVVVKSLQRWYKAGDIVDCKAASFAGLLGGADISNGSRVIVWGALPRADRHLLILEELKGLDPRIFTQLTETRSSGIARLQRIAAATTMARTRMLMVSNPRVNLGGMRSQSSMWDVVIELVGSDEDARRFDMVSFVVQGTREKTHLPASFSASVDAFRRLLLWTWSRKSTNVQYETGLADTIATAAEAIASLHDADEPVVTRSTLHEKVLRIAAAIAARTASMADYCTLFITKAHVEVAGRLLTRLYRCAEYSHKVVIRVDLLRDLLIRCSLTKDLQWVRSSWLRLRVIDDASFVRLYCPRTIEPTTVFKILGIAGAIHSRPAAPGSYRQVQAWSKEFLVVLSDPQHELWKPIEGKLDGITVADSSGLPDNPF